MSRIVFLDQQKSLDETMLVVADTNTQQYIPFKGNFRLLVLPSDITAKMEWVNYVRSQQHYKTLLAFGSGTINDICKYASYLDATDFITCPTAPSVNGYCSSTASIIVNSIKKSYKAHLPKIIYISLDILTHSPMRLILSGFSEVMCRFTTQIDWLLSHLLLGTGYTDVPFNLTKKLEKQLIIGRGQLILRNERTIQSLMETLLLSGLGMNISGGSYPWSQGEHQIVHTMEVYDKSNDYFHGEKVGAATITMSKLHNFILQDLLRGDAYSMMEEKVLKYYKQADEHIQIIRLKHEKLKLDKWPAVAEKIRALILDTNKLRDILSSAGAPTEPEEVGWQTEEYKIGCEVACAMRDRFTFLDLLIYSSKEFSFC